MGFSANVSKFRATHSCRNSTYLRGIFPFMRRSLILLTSICFCFACKKHTSSSAATPTEPVSVTTLQDPRLIETSGIAASVANPGLLYVHNDSGDTSRFFAIHPAGSLKAVIYYNGDKSLKLLGVTDCEDIAVNIGPQPGTYVYMGDIGDNGAVRKDIIVFRIKEPALSDTLVNAQAEPLVLTYPDGPRDAETLMVDPIDKLIYIVSKREDSVGVYSTPLLFNANDTAVLQLRAKLYFSGFGETRYITAGDISQDGLQILLKSYTQVYYWKRQSGEAIWQSMLRSPETLPYTIEHQGEAIGFTTDATGYYTTGEGLHANLYYYTLPK
jgi:hypothetical protein